MCITNKNLRKQIELILILVATAFVANFLNDLQLFTNGTYPIYNQMLFFAIGYICVAKMLAFKSNWHTGLVIGVFVFMSLCSLLYYANTIIDFSVFGISLYSVIVTLAFLKAQYDKTEG